MQTLPADHARPRPPRCETANWSTDSGKRPEVEAADTLLRFQLLRLKPFDKPLAVNVIWFRVNTHMSYI